MKASTPIEGTPAETYLRSRGITMALPHTLRFARLAPPKQPEDNGLLVSNGPEPLPCLVAIVTDPDGVLVGIQRTYLTAGGRKAAAADGKVKYSLGMVAGGAIQLGGPAETIVVCEGLEDGLTLAQALDQTVWVSAGTKMLPQMTMPAATRAVVIGADGDEPGECAAQAAATAFREAQLAVRIMRPTPPYKDFNAELCGVAA
jgi:DNA primase